MWTDAQADLSLSWAHSHFVGFVVLRLICTFKFVVCILQKLVFFHKMAIIIVALRQNLDLCNLQRSNKQEHLHILFSHLFDCYMDRQPQCYLRTVRYEPPHDKTNKMTVRPAKTQISLGIRPGRLESSLCAQWVFFMRTAKTLIRLDECPGWSESLPSAKPFCCFCHEAANMILYSCMRGASKGLRQGNRYKGYWW